MLHCSLQNAVSRMSDIDVNDAFAKRMAQVNVGVFDVVAKKKYVVYNYIGSNPHPVSSSHHQDYYMFSRESL